MATTGYFSGSYFAPRYFANNYFTHAAAEQSSSAERRQIQAEIYKSLLHPKAQRGEPHQIEYPAMPREQFLQEEEEEVAMMMWILN